MKEEKEESFALKAFGLEGHITLLLTPAMNLITEDEIIRESFLPQLSRLSRSNERGRLNRRSLFPNEASFG